MILVSDAAPLIFLAKLDRLELIKKLFGEAIFIPKRVADEVLNPPLPPDEELTLQRFLQSVHIIYVHVSPKNQTSLSLADLSVCQLAVEQKADVVLSDDKLLRRLLQAEGLTPLGTLGLLIRAMEKGVLSKSDVRRCLGELIKKHRFRISIELFECVLEHLQNA